MSRRSMVKWGVFLWLVAIGAAVYFYIQENMTAFFIALAVVVLAVLAVVLVFVIAFAKDGLIKDAIESNKYRRESLKVSRKIDRADRQVETIERRYEPRIEKLEDEIRAMEEYLDAKALTMTESQRKENLQKLEALEKKLEALEKEAEQAIDKPLRKKLETLKAANARLEETKNK